MINITNVQINSPKNTNSKILAFAKITIDDSFVVDNLKIIDGSKGIFVAMPSNKNTKTQEFQDIAFPITKECRKYVTETILEAYNKTDDNDPF